MLSSSFGMKGRTLAMVVLVILVAVWFAIEDASAGCITGCMRDGYRGLDIIKKTKTDSILRCFRLCKGDKECTAFNYNKQTTRCELLMGNELTIYPFNNFSFVGNGAVVKVGSLKAVSCSSNINPKELAEASVSVNTRRTFATYTCKDSYTRTAGKILVRCHDLQATNSGVDQEWENPTIVCKAMCPNNVNPILLPHGNVEVNSERTTATYTCNPPFVHSSNLTTVECLEVVAATDGSSQPSRVWETAAIVCEVACPDDVKPKEMRGATVTVNEERTIATYQCQLPYEKISGSTTVQCEVVSAEETFLQWEPATIVCEEALYNDDETDELKYA